MTSIPPLREDLKTLDVQLKELLASYNTMLIPVPYIAPDGTIKAHIAYADVETEPTKAEVGKLQDVT